MEGELLMISTNFYSTCLPRYHTSPFNLFIKCNNYLCITSVISVGSAKKCSDQLSSFTKSTEFTCVRQSKTISIRLTNLLPSTLLRYSASTKTLISRKSKFHLL